MGLIAWFSLDGKLDNKGTSNYTISSSSSSYETGKVTQKSIRFNGHQMYFTNPFVDKNEWSLSFWWKNNGSGDWADVFAFNGGYSRLEIFNSNKSWNWYCDDTSTGDIFDPGTNFGDGVFTTNTWYHIVITFNNGTSTFYIDGVQKVQQSGKKTFTSSSSRLYFGSRVDSQYANMNLNDVRCYDHCLSNVEIKNLSRALVLHYNFEELYKPLEYLESSGTQYINPGVGFVNGSSFAYELKCQYPTTTTTTTGSGHHRATISCTNGQLKVGYTQTSASALDWHTAKVSWNGGNVGDTLTQTNYLDGVQVGTAATQPYDSNPYLLFACCSWTDNTGIPPYSYEKMRISECKIYVNNEIVRNLIPSLRNIDGKVGLYDKVNGTFYTNAGTGDFYYEGCFEPVNYQNASITNNNITFSKSSDGWGDSGILAKESFSKGYVAATVAQSDRYIMIGMASVNNSYNYTQGYFIYPSNNGHYHIYEMGNHIGDMGTYAANDRFHVVYDGAKISYYINATLVREVGVSGKMYMNITNYNAASATIKDVCYGSLDFVKDNSGNELDGFPYNCSVNTETKTGEYSLDTTTSNGYIKLPNLYLDTKFTITGWVKHGQHSTWARIFDFGTAEGGADYAIGLATSDTGGTICVFGRAGAGASLPDTYVTTWAANTWYHFAVVVNETNIKFYVNGSEIYSFTASSVIGGRLYKYNYIAKSNWSTDGYSRKYMSDFKIYNTSLSASDIKDLYETRMIIDNKGNIYCEKLIDKQSSCEFPNNQGLIKATDFMVSNEAQINGEYDLLEYIESTGTQYIDTGVKQTNKGCIDCKFHNVTTSADYWFGSRQSSSYFMLYNGFYNNAILEYNWLTINYTSSPFVEMKQRIEGNDIIISINGVQTRVATGTADNNNIFIFACNNASVRYYAGKLRLYYFKMYDNNVLVRDYIPVRRKSDGVVGLLDKVSGVLYTNKGSGQFYTYTELEYIQTSGSQAINTGYSLTTNSSWDVTFALTSTANGQIIAGTWNNGTAVSQLTTYQNTIAIQHLATDTTTGMGQITTNTNKHTIFLSQGKQTADGSTVSTSSIAGAAPNALYIGSRGGASGYCNARFYGCKIWEGGSLVRDFTPAKRSDGVVGMYDKVNNTFYTNAGSGTFISGANLDTLLTPNSGTCYLVGGKNIYEGMGASVNPKY